MTKTLHDQVTRDEVLNRLRSLHHDSAAHWGKMNVGKMLCHVSDSLRMALGAPDTLEGQKALPDAHRQVPPHPCPAVAEGRSHRSGAPFHATGAVRS